MLERIIDCIRHCPFISGNVTKDFLSHTDGAVGVQLLACEPVIQQYVDGDSLRQAVFRLSFRECDSKEAPDRDAVHHQITSWLENCRSSLPVLAEGQTAQRIELLKTEAQENRTFGGDCYSAEYRLIYYQKGV